MPLGKNVVIIPKQKMEVTEGGIVLPPEAQRPEITGILLAIGEETSEDFKAKAKEGATVVFPQFAGVSFKFEDDEGKQIDLLIMPFDRLVAVLETKEE